MKASDVINTLIYHLSDTESDYDVLIEDDKDFKIEVRDGVIHLLATD